jgi:hypothetical protein
LLVGVATGIRQDVAGLIFFREPTCAFGYEPRDRRFAMVMGSVTASAIGSVGTKKWVTVINPIASLIDPIRHLGAPSITVLALLVES